MRPTTRSSTRTAWHVAIGLAVVGAGLAIAPAGVGAADLQYHCHSLLGESDTAYTMTATAPASVAQGASFQVKDLVVTGTPPVDLLIAHITFGIDVPANASPAGPSTFSFDGPGSTDPPGPIAKKGVPNSSPPMTFTLTATGPVGSTIDIFPGDVASTVVDPQNLQSRLDVVCSQVVPTPLLRVTIVAPTDETTTTASTAPDNPGVAVLGVTATPATPVAAQPAVTG